MAGYKTICNSSQSKFNEKRSQFLSFAFHITSVDQAKELIKLTGNKYNDSRHVCYAYALGATREITMSSDNGEPSGTAGKPILGQILSHDLSDILIVVVRYFGGVKLGTPGLIAAYRKAADDVINASEIITFTPKTSLQVTFSFPAMNKVMQFLKTNNLAPVKRNFDNQCSLEISVDADKSEEIQAKLVNLECQVNIIS